MPDRTEDFYLTTSGLIKELQRQIATDPARADQPVVILPTGLRTRYQPTVACGIGVGDDQQVAILAQRQR